MNETKYAEFVIYLDDKESKLQISESLSKFYFNDETRKEIVFGKEMWITEFYSYLSFKSYVFEFYNEIDLANTIYKLAKKHEVDIKTIAGAHFLFESIEWQI